MDALLLGIVVLFVLWCAAIAAVGFALVHVARAARRRGTALAGRARRDVLRFTGGPRGDVAALRHELERAIDGVDNGLRAARMAGLPIGDIPHLLQRLRAAATEVDAELRVLDAVLVTGPAAEWVERRTAEVRVAVGAVLHGARELGDALLEAARSQDAVRTDLRDACAREAAALREGSRAARLA